MEYQIQNLLSTPYYLKTIKNIFIISRKILGAF